MSKQKTFMSKQRFIKRYSLIINFIRRTPASFENIQKYLQRESFLEEENYEIELRTFQRDLKEIESLFGIKISNNRAKGVYEFVDNSDEAEDKYDRLMESFEIFNALHLSNHYNKEIIFEKRKSLGLENMNGLLHAIKKRCEIQFIHEKYWTDDENKQLRIIQPIALKEARFRWYLIGNDTKDSVIKTFALDRMSQLEILPKIFKSIPNYDAKTAFQYSFGIIKSNSQIPEKIILSFSYHQGKYIKSFPLHHSQKQIIDNENEFRIELMMHPTYDFVMELLSIGSHVKVVEPKSLQDEIMKRLKETLSLYK